MHAISVLIWNGDLDEADVQIERFKSNSESYNLESHVLLGRCFEGQLAISRGKTEYGTDLLQTSLRDLRALRYELMTTQFNISLVQAFTTIGRFEEGLALVDAAIQSVETNGDCCFMPELFRVKANLLLCLPQPLDGLAETHLAESLALSRRQGALAWELRTSIDLAKRLGAGGRRGQASALLQPVMDRFANGAETADLRIAKDLL